jgi:hypothetical protein
VRRKEKERKGRKKKSEGERKGKEGLQVIYSNSIYNPRIKLKESMQW